MKREELRQFLKARTEGMPIVWSQRNPRSKCDFQMREGDIVKADLLDEYRLEMKVLAVGASYVRGVVMNDFSGDCCLYGIIHLGDEVEVDFDCILACSRNG